MESQSVITKNIYQLVICLADIKHLSMINIQILCFDLFTIWGFALAFANCKCFTKYAVLQTPQSLFYIGVKFRFDSRVSIKF